MRRIIFRNIVAIVILAGILFYVTSYAGIFQQQAGVKGASTERAKNIAGKIGSDVGTQINTAEKQVMQVKISDIVNELSRFQRVPQDINSITGFVQTQVNNVVESRNRKK